MRRQRVQNVQNTQITAFSTGQKIKHTHMQKLPQDWKSSLELDITLHSDLSAQATALKPINRTN